MGLVNCHRDLWRNCAHTLAPLTKSCPSKIKFNWADVEHKALVKPKKIVGRDVILSYPNFSEKFIIYTDASKFKIGGVISQNGRPIAFYSCKLTPAQINYTTIEI